jgi:hypothetical protein
VYYYLLKKNYRVAGSRLTLIFNIAMRASLVTHAQRVTGSHLMATCLNTLIYIYIYILFFSFSRQSVEVACFLLFPLVVIMIPWMSYTIPVDSLVLF